MEINYWRQQDLYNPNDDNNKILVIGCGHIGSFIAYGLSAIGSKNINVVDFDKVESHNLPNQFFAGSLLSEASEGEILKINALQKTLKYMFPSQNISIFNCKIEELWITDWDAIFIATDNIESREYVFHKFKYKILIDVRTGGQMGSVFSIESTDRESMLYYANSLKGEFTDAPCTARCIADISMQLSGAAITRYRQYLTKNLIAIHTYHDGINGTVSFMNYHLKENKNENNNSN